VPARLPFPRAISPRRERVNAGLARATAQGKRLGRPQEITDKKRAAVLTARAKGHSFGMIAKALDMPRGTVAYIVSRASETA
jgi:putative DNA-invertase from lambdoid prophage Rac